MYSVPIGQKGFWSGKALGSMFNTFVVIGILVIFLVLIVQITFPQLMIFVVLGIIGLVIVFFSIVCASLVGSARESLEAAEKERNRLNQSKGYRIERLSI